MSRIDIHLVNFKCWVDKTFTLVQGVNLFKGKSGNGKSTVCKAIYFVLYGGRKFTKISNWKLQGQRTEVSLTFISPFLEYKITRSRPPETLYILIKDKSGIYQLKDKEAQSWIDSQFGIENNWLASSYISRKKQHFLIDSNNTDKMRLLQHLAFGDENSLNQPDTYLEPTKAAIVQYNEYLKNCNENLKIQQNIRQTIITRNQNIQTYPHISKEDHNVLITKNDEEKKKLDEMKINLTVIQSRRNLTKQLEKLETFTNSIDEITDKIELLKKKEKKYILKSKLKNFNISVLEVERKVLEIDNYLYSKYLSCGWTPDKPLDSFIAIIKKEISLYESQMRLEEENNKIRKNNNAKEETNKALLKAYNKQKSDYDTIIKEINEYNKKKDKLITQKKEMENEVHIKLSDKDDLSANWIIGFKVGIEMSLQELICPHCNHGLIYENGRLQLGTLEGSSNDNCENIRKKQRELLGFANIEYEKRKLREEFLVEYELFSKIIPRKEPDLPDEPKYYEMEPLIPTKNLTKPSLDVFDKPTFDYSTYQSLWNSLHLVDDYKLFTSLNVELDVDENKIKNEIVILENLRSKIKEVTETRARIETIISTLPEDIPDIEIEIQKLENNISNNNQLIVAANIMREIETIDSQINTLNESVKTTILYLGYLEHFYNETEGLATTSLLKKLNELNGPISVILTDLFNYPINVELTPYKTLKNGETKTQINFNVSFKASTMDTMDDFSDGEEGRLSLALLMAFSRINKNPFVIIDEILSSVENELQVECIDIIDKWTSGKFVIHICHNVSEGHHYNVIDFPPILE